ncbi:secondary thiamine-phosphate synthase enzyme YjbQ [Patescibacteria group bacterium]|nr:secondary thiamine-phosphate synthase enzyme YjbQ [Patescibacteria group bacterium]
MVTIKVTTEKNKQVIDITHLLSAVAQEHENGILQVFVRHTTCAIATADLDPGAEEDYMKAFEKIAPPLTYAHPHDPSHFNDHLLSTIIGTDLSIPVKSGALTLGTWQKIVLFEFSGPREREIVVNYIKEE